MIWDPLQVFYLSLEVFETASAFDIEELDKE